ncbi:Ubiquitin carboxyl-terminal hydrolase 16 [Labeo rohita]|uniref:Ubiquitin carboxyl-terminal hydrolase 16 n=1 Tax=Labeo rohita TaxID=84645 RepID=A0ABQ8M2L9_LABRO|nr:Ubiquitin carboxyl-terminal hydrolase 16 [Labeo rohita]
MGKKKGKDRSPRADSSTDTAGVSCTHIRKGTDHSLLKKAGLNVQWSSCQDCEPDKPVEKQILEDETDRESPAVWMCLKCGHRGCGRSENQHAIKHYETPRSEPHCLVLSLDVWSVWCYICDEEVQYSRTGQLAQLITNIKKQVLTDPGKKNSNRKSKKEESLETNPVEHTLDEEKENENKEKQKSSSKHDDSPKKQKTAAAGSSGVVSVRGLSNLGNTCFFNAVVQNLSQTQFLRELLNKITDEKSCFTITPALLSELEPLKIQLERPGSLTLAMCQLLNEIKETKKSVVTPKELFTQVCKKAPRFKGFQQQDSQELLRYLLDGVRAEELKRVNSGILEALKSSGKSLGAEQMKKVIKEYEKNGAPKNFVDRVFGGEMCSTVMCKECRTVSLVTEMFLDLSLPVADEAYRKKNQKKVAQHRSSVSDDGENTTSLTNGNEDMPTGTGSKYQQKKAKKQAKKQAKTQRRQQKLGSKVTLDALTNQSTASSTDPVDASNQSVSVNGSADAEAGENSQENLSPEKPPAVSQNEDEDDEEPEQEHSTSVNNRFNALTEDQTSEDVSVEEDKPQDVNATEEENGADQPCAEEDQLVEELNTLTLKTASEGEMENGDESSGDAKEYTVVNQDPELAFKSLASRTAPEKQECSVESCLYQFTEVEHLIENNRLLCKKAVYRDALKQMLISDPPAGVKEGETQVLYSLYGIVEHSGTMRSGHYTAYVKSRPSTRSHVENGLDADCHAETSKGSWFHISDSSVHPVTEAKDSSAKTDVMSRSVICPLSVGATAPESLSILQSRLKTAEQQTEELMRSLGSLGASADELLVNSLDGGPSTRPISPVNIQRALSAGGEGLLWRQCETLVARVCRLESVLHALKLTTFRLDTDRQLNPCHTARLQERLTALQEQHEEEQRSSRREMKEQMIQETTAHLEAEQSHSALLLRVKEMERVVERERRQVEVLQADCHALRTDGQANRAELKKREEQILGLERECQALRDQSGVKETLMSQLTKEIKSVKAALQKQQQENSTLIRDGRDLRAAADQVQVLNEKLEVQCSELSTTLHSLTLENTRLQTEYHNKIKAERERVSKHLEEQDLLLDTARRNIQAELQGTISEKLTLQKQLEALKADHAKLQQSSTISQETAVSHQQMLERTIESLQGDLSCAVKDGETLREERDRIKSEMNSAVVLLEKEKNILETQLSEMKVELTMVNSALQKQKEENKELMESLAALEHQQVTHRQVEQMLWDMTDSKNKLAYEKGKLQARVQQMAADLKTLKAECTQYCQSNTALQNTYTQMQRENQTLKEQLCVLQQQHRDTNEVAQTLENVLSSHTRLQQNTQTLHAELREKAQELHTLRSERLQAMKEIQRLEAEVENDNAKNNEKVESLQKALEEAQLDNRKLGQSLEQALRENHNVQEKLNALSESSEAELKKARAEIHRLTEHVDSLKNLLKREKDSGRKSAQRLKKALNDASAKSGDLLQANQELRVKVSELEKLVSNQKSQLNHYLDNRTSLNHCLRIKDLEAEIKSLEEAKDEYKKRSYEQSQSLLQLRSEMVSLQSELQCLSSTQQGELQAERDLNRTLQEKCRLCSISKLQFSSPSCLLRPSGHQYCKTNKVLENCHYHLEESLKRLQDERDEAEVRLREVCLESQQITENMDEDHRGLCSKSESFNGQAEPQKLTESLCRVGRDGPRPTTAQTRVCFFDPELEPWASALQRWEIKKELGRIAGSYKPKRHCMLL